MALLLTTLPSDTFWLNAANHQEDCRRWCVPFSPQLRSTRKLMQVSVASRLVRPFAGKAWRMR